jgi:DNA adenine methylase
MVEAPLKWAGGKRWLVRKFPELFEVEFDRYIEPFLGSGAVYFHLSPARALLSDKNTELINLYASIKADPLGLLALMSEHARLHSESHYYATRSSTPNTRLGRAARFLYLNRTCWNGLYRENKKGQFNVPIGTKNTVVFPNETFEDVAETLRGADLTSGDFVGLLELATQGDLVFVDPPYTVRHNNNGFIKYNEQIFSWEDQVRLARSVELAAERGAKVIVTNALHDSVVDLYRHLGGSFRVGRHSVLAGASNARGPAEEAVFLVGEGLDRAARALSRHASEGA